MDAMSIIKEVARRYGVTAETLRSKEMPFQLLHARREAYRRLRDDRKLSYTVIGRLMGERDHTTILSALRHVSDVRASDIIEHCAAQNGVTVTALKNRRDRRAQRLRRGVYTQLRDIGITETEIGRLMGRKPTSVKRRIQFTESHASCS